MSRIPTITSIVKRHGLEVMADAEKDREGWLEARKSVVTASDIPAIVGVCPGVTKLWYQRKGWISRPDFKPEAEEAMEMGHLTEAFNAELFRLKTQRNTTPCQLLIRNPKWPWIAVTPDFAQFFAGSIDHGILETKSTGQKDNWPEGDDEEPSLRWQAQLQAQMLVTEASFGSLSAIIGSPYLHHRWRDFEPHAGMQQLILDRTRTFLDSLAGDEPPWDEESESAAEALRALTLQYLSGEAVNLTLDAVEWTNELEQINATLSLLKLRHDALQRQLALSLGTATRGLLPNGDEWLFTPQTRGEHVVKESTFRVLRHKSQDRHREVKPLLVADDFGRLLPPKR
jgi:putative phage-type endonuclease